MGIEEQPNVENNESMEPINHRQEQMIVFLNHVTGSDYSVDAEGYSEAGRSQGILEKLAPNDELREGLSTMFGSISRNK